MQEFKVGDYVKYIGSKSHLSESGYVVKVEGSGVWVKYETGPDTGETLYSPHNHLELVVRLPECLTEKIENKEVKSALDTLIKAGYTVTLSKRH